MMGSYERRGAARRHSIEISGPDLFSLVEVFGGIFAVLLFVYFSEVLMVGGASRLLPPMNDPGEYRVSWPGKGSGWVVIVYRRHIALLETNERADAGHICDPTGPFVRYVRRVYLSREDYLVFGIVEGAIPRMVEARNCLLSMFPNQPIRISTVAADREFFKAVGSEAQLPRHLETVFKNNMIGGQP